MSNEYDWEKGLIVAPGAVGPPPQEYKSIVEAGDLDALESLLMARFDALPSDIAFALPAYKFFVKKKEIDRAEVLLQLHVEALRHKNESSAETGLACSLLGFWPECTAARDSLLYHLKKMYFDSPGFARLTEHLKTAESQGLDTLRLLEAWLRFDEGRCVYMPSKGAGRVREVNLGLGVLRVAFESGGQMSFKIDEAQRLCQSLPREHFLSKKLDSPQELASLAASAPGDLLGFLFASVKRPLPLPELRGMLSGVVSDAGWSGWWASARKDRRITVGEGTKALVTWSDSADQAALAVAQRFAAAASREKPDLMRKHSGRSPGLASLMHDGIVNDANAACATDPSLALELALQLDQPGGPGRATLCFTPQSIVERPDCAGIVADVKDRAARKKAVTLVHDARADWPQLYVAMLRLESDSQIISILYQALSGASDPAVLERAVSATLDDPASAPHFYVWLCREMPSTPQLKSRAGAGFLLVLIRMLDNKAFRGYHAALRKLFDLGGGL